MSHAPRLSHTHTRGTFLSGGAVGSGADVECCSYLAHTLCHTNLFCCVSLYPALEENWLCDNMCVPK